MPNPKRRNATGRRDRRRSHDRLQAPGLSLCPNCYELKLPHHACPSCGYYKGRVVVETEEE